MHDLNAPLPDAPFGPNRPAPKQRAATPIAFVNAIVLAYQRRGMDASTALAAAQIAPTLLADPHARISAWQMERVSDAAMRELDDEALGWFGRRLPWGSYGMLARASISAPNLGVALQRWCRHHGLIADDITLSLSAAGPVARLQITEPRDLGAMREFCLVSLLRNFHGLACWLIDSRIPLTRADFAYAAPAHHTAYQVLFSAPAQFEQALTAIEFDSQYLQLPLRRDEPALRQMLKRALPLTVLQYRRDRLLVQRVRQALAQHPAATHSADGVAALLAMSPRTLHRQLRDEGASLQALKDEVRFAHAHALLLRSQRPLKQIAQAVGFQSEKSFMRAFKAHTGLSPTALRQRAQAVLPVTPLPPAAPATHPCAQTVG